MERQQAFLDLLAESGHIGLWTYQPVPPQLWADAAALRILRCAAASSLADLLHALECTDREGLQKVIAEACARQSGFARSVRLAAPDGGCTWCAWWSARLRC